MKGSFSFISAFSILLAVNLLSPVARSQEVDSSSSCVAKALTSANEPTTAELQESYAKIAPQRYWGNWIDDEAEYRRLINKTDWDKLVKSVHPTEMYGLKTFLAWKAGADYLDKIPVGKFNPSLELFSKVNELTTAAEYPILKKLTALIPDGYVPSRGGIIKKAFPFAKEPLYQPLTEEQYQSIKDNHWLNGFVELPSHWSYPGHRMGLILFSKPSEIQAKLEKLIRWYDENKNSMDPIELAALFQKNFVSIHPYVDGNGRSSRLLMDRILAEHGLPPPILTEQNDDLYVSSEKYVSEVRQGIQQYFDLKKGLKNSGPPPSVNRNNMGTQKTGLGLRTPMDRQTMEHPPAHMDTFTGWPAALGNPEIRLGGLPFTMMQDGFFYSNKGIPYVFHDGTLYPISDQSYLLYFARSRDTAQGTADRLTDAQKEVYQTHFNLLKSALDRKTLDPDSIKIAPYDGIREANDKNLLHLYPWQRKAFLDGVTINATDPAAVLNESRIMQTPFEMSQGKVNFFGTSDVIAQYEAADLKMSKNQSYAKKNFPEAVPTIIESRRKLHTAARTLLTNFLKDLAALSPEDKAKLSTFAPFQVWMDYFGHSKLSSPDFDQALKNSDDSKVYLLRNDEGRAGSVGFRSMEDYKRIFESLPYSSKIKAYLKKLSTYLSDPKNKEAIDARLKNIKAGVDKNQAIIKLLPKNLQALSQDINGTYGQFTDLLGRLDKNVFASKYDSRGTSEEFERSYVDFVIHATGSAADQADISFTTSLSLLIPKSISKTGGLTYGSQKDSSLFVAHVDKSQVDWDIASGFGFEYEVLAESTVHRRSIQSQYKGTDLNTYRPSDLTPAGADFLKKYQIGVENPVKPTDPSKAVTPTS